METRHYAAIGSNGRELVVFGLGFDAVSARIDAGLDCGLLITEEVTPNMARDIKASGCVACADLGMNVIRLARELEVYGF